MKECPACRRCFPDDIIHCPQDGDATLPSLLGEPILDARYQLERRLGQGGMGVVFQARHIFLKTAHAIKIILPDLVGNDPMLVTRFRQEALAAAAIRHQNIISVTDFGVVRSTMPFLVMEFVKGKSLQEIMAEEGAMPSARAYELICPTAAGVAAAHRQNIVHRDLKPLNIMLQDNMPPSEGLKILDFGLAKIKSGELLGSFVQAKTSGLMGSPFYMAPEQWSDEEPDARADIYSLGIILYQMLAGDVPFKGSSIPSIMKKHLTTPVPTFRSMGVQVPPQIEAVVRHALEKEVSARTPNVEAFLDELKAAVNSTSAMLKTTGDRASVDPNQTFVSAPPSIPPQGTTTQASGLQTNFDPHAGTISSSALDEEIQQQLSATGEAFRREQEDKELFAREELAREAGARKRAEEEAERKRKEEERERKEQAEREEKERKQSEQLERVARQAEELEEKLARLSVSMPPPTTTLIDPDATQVQQRAGATQAVGSNSLDATQGSWQGVAPKKKSSVGVIAGVIILVLLAGGGISGYFYLRHKPVVNPNDPNNDPNKNNPPVAIKPELIEIPGGTFQMGRVGGHISEEPVHAVTVKPFVIDKTEVTNGEYAQFVNDTKHSAPSNWAGNKPIPGEEALPVTFVSYDDATVFAEWRSKRDNVQYRLPSEEEWEYAARGGDQDNLYPWGNKWVEDYALTKYAGATAPKPVGSSPHDKTRWGVMDMMGNVYEWTSTKANFYPGSPLKVKDEDRAHYVIRGASYLTGQTPLPISAARRDWFSGNTKVSQLGFRLVRDGGR
jgi:formylglycine-generating enzyme required for sulfatase activity/serine/threonine protein kinase